MSVTVVIAVEGIADVLANYDAIHVQRSALGSPYTDAVDVTGDASTKPAIVGTLEGAFDNLQGKTLILAVDKGSDQTVLFSDPDPIALVAVIAEISQVLTGATPKNDGTGKLKIEGNNPGTDGHLKIVDGTSLAILGLTKDAESNGKDIRPTLQAGVSLYSYTDNGGLSGYYYRTRYHNTTTAVYSAWSDWRAVASEAISASKLITAKVRLAGADGSALASRKVTIRPVNASYKVEGYGIQGGAVTITTDSQGLAQTDLVMGAVVDVLFGGTDLVRRITVPSSGTEFDLLDDSLVTHDPWEIKKADIPDAIRRS